MMSMHPQGTVHFECPPTHHKYLAGARRPKNRVTSCLAHITNSWKHVPSRLVLHIDSLKLLWSKQIEISAHHSLHTLSDTNNKKSQGRANRHSPSLHFLPDPSSEPTTKPLPRTDQPKARGKGRLVGGPWPPLALTPCSPGLIRSR